METSPEKNIPGVNRTHVAAAHISATMPRTNHYTTEIEFEFSSHSLSHIPGSTGFVYISLKGGHFSSFESRDEMSPYCREIRGRSLDPHATNVPVTPIHYFEPHIVATNANPRQPGSTKEPDSPGELPE